MTGIVLGADYGDGVSSPSLAEVNEERPRMRAFRIAGAGFERNPLTSGRSLLPCSPACFGDRVSDFRGRKPTVRRWEALLYDPQNLR